MPKKHPKMSGKPKPRKPGRTQGPKALTGTTTVSSEFKRYSATHLPFSSTFRTKMSCSFMGTLPASTPASGYFYVSGNSAHTPFNSTGVYASRSINYYSASGYASASYASIQPEGFSSVCAAGAVYGGYRIHGSTCKLTLRPTSTADNIMAVISANQIGQNSTTQIWTAAEAPFASRLRTFTSIEQDKYIISKRTTSEMFSVPDSAIRTGDVWIGSPTGSPGNEWAFIIQWQTVDNTTTDAVMGISVQMEYDIEFIQPNVGGLPDVLLSDDCHPDSTVQDKDESTSSVLLPRGEAKFKHGTTEHANEPDDLIWVDGSQYLRVGATEHYHAKRPP